MNNMNHFWVNQEATYIQTNTQGLYLSRHNDNHKLKMRAYINPHYTQQSSMTNNSQLASTKIHINPNFKGFGTVQKNSLILNKAANPVANLQPNAVVPEPGTSGNEGTQLIKAGSNTFSELSAHNRFKKVNNVSVKTGSKSKFSWTKSDNNAPTLNSNLNKKKLTFVAQNVPINSEKPKTLIASQNIYKYTAPKKATRVVNSKRCLIPDKNSSSDHLSKVKIINKSKTKLINTTSPRNKLVCKSIKTPIKRHVNLPHFTYNKNMKSPITRVAATVKNKYKYSNLILRKNTKYKIDKRKKVLETPLKKSNRGNDIRKLFPSSHTRVIYKRAHLYYSVAPNRNIHHWRKESVKELSSKKMFPNRRVVKIGGILYKSTSNKLTIANKKHQQTNLKTSNTTKKVGKNHIVYVRGEKFVLDKNGKTLRRESQNLGSSNTKMNTPRRIDIGGVTYIQKSQNVLIRTNVHQARYVVNKAKSKSIATLTNLYRRSSMPCMIYHKFGRCIRHMNGSCMYKHDPKNIALCKKFLKGNCDDKNCLLSHEAVQEKMATCRFFLNGFCTKENCPFLHVKLSRNTSICKNFLQGFCKLGKDCTKRHFYQCPDFDKYGKCKLGTKCHYPHKVPEGSFEKSSESTAKEQNEVVQYFVKELHPGVKRKQGKTKRTLLESKQDSNKKSQKKGTKNKNSPSDQNNDTEECVPKRIKLQELPCYIPLKSDSQS